ncbi:dienelactone hydrolase family protein [Pengzhenrongella frigida]|uniref:Dienelactone hydrolase n=1 Tax=Pengzhenrongella frigida TaxID=1259133 RepID=A0A4Q5MWR1_9MICO|nr:dienelactone hydrolase family protein [Cellulomonas sp. HLT2-17]RYV50142.1 dienelactone hydrolase [Cellulomonas sp. HLT2-17]
MNAQAVEPSGEPDEVEIEAAQPDRRTTGPGVVVVHDWYGPLPHVAELADELTMAGFDVELVDLYDGVTTDDPGRAEVLAEALDGTDALEQIAAAAQRLREAGAGYVGAVGFSLGGSLVLRVAAGRVFDAVVVYYATCGLDDAAGLTCPVQLHLADDDEFEPAEDVAEFVEALRAAGAPVDTFTYAGTEHSFANADVALADPRAAEVALARTVGFLHARLAG